jgi:cytochrome c2
MYRKILSIIALLILLIFTACGGKTQETSVNASVATKEETAVTEGPTILEDETATADTSSTEEASIKEKEVVNESATATEGAAVNDENLITGNPERGQEIFLTGGGVIDSTPCSNCHSLDGSVLRGPSLQGISDRAGERVPGLSAIEYLNQSILDPSAYLVEGFDNSMSSIWKIFMSEEDINDMVAFLLTQ